MAINEINNLPLVNAKKFPKSPEVSASPSRASKGNRDSEEAPEAAEASVSAEARRLQERAGSGASNDIGTEAGSALDSGETASTEYWLDLAASTSRQILQQPSTALFAQANSLPRQVLALING
jgi:hypothetical protein